MDEFFELYSCSDTSLWFEEAPKVGFQTYTKQPFVGFACSQNVNKKMIEFLRRSWVAPPRKIEPEKDRNVKHKMVERMRRKSHKQLYLALHHSLPYGTKNDKNSIQEMAVKQIEELRRHIEELKNKNKEMEMILGGREIEKAEINLKVDNPASGIDSMLQVLQYLKNSETTLTALRSKFLDHEFAAAIEFETKMKAADVERAIQRTLFEAEMTFRSTN